MHQLVIFYPIVKFLQTACWIKMTSSTDATVLLFVCRLVITVHWCQYYQRRLNYTIFFENLDSFKMRHNLRSWYQCFRWISNECTIRCLIVTSTYTFLSFIICLSKFILQRNSDTKQIKMLLQCFYGLAIDMIIGMWGGRGVFNTGLIWTKLGRSTSQSMPLILLTYIIE